MKKSKNWGNYLFFLGPILAVIGLVAGMVADDWQIPGFLLIVGITTMVIWFFLQIRRGKLDEWLGGRSMEAGTNALIATVSVLVILGLINVLGVRYNTRLDLTENQQFTLAPQSQTLVSNLEQPAKVWVFDRGQNPQVQDLLDNYRRLNNSQFSYEVVDPQAQPGLANEFGVKDFGEIYLELGEQRRLISKGRLEPLSEAALTNGLEQLLNTRTLIAYFLQGHGELPLEGQQGSLSNAVQGLKNKNYEVKPLNLAELSGVPEDADVVILASPKRPLFEGEVTALKEYLDQGGGLLLMIDPNTDHGLNRLFEAWGVELDTRLAIDASGSGRLIGLGPTVPLVTQYGDHPITQSFGNSISFYPMARPVETRPVEGITESPLIWTNEASWAESDLSSRELQFDPNQDRQGPLSLGVALTRAATVATESPTPAPSPSPAPEATATPSEEDSPAPSPSPSPEATATPTEETTPSADVQEARLVVIGNSQFATNGWFEQQLNGDVFLNTVSWLSQPDQPAFSIRPRSATNRRIVMSNLEAGILSWIALVILPLFGFGAAIIVWWRRR